MKVVRNNSNHRDFQGLVKLLDDELNSRYGVIQEGYNRYNSIEFLDIVVIGYLNNIPIACRAFKIFDKHSVEIKRMFVKSEHRGTGIAKIVLEDLENCAFERGFSKAVLETGIKQPEAIKFYSKLGYYRIENYGQYIGNLNSICMTKIIRGE